jgi:hypothetical protein
MSWAASTAEQLRFPTRATALFVGWSAVGSDVAIQTGGGGVDEGQVPDGTTTRRGGIRVWR